MTHHLCWHRFVQLQLEHIESRQKGRRRVVDAAVGLSIGLGEGQSIVAIPVRCVVVGVLAAAAFGVVGAGAGAGAGAVVNGFAKGQ